MGDCALGFSLTCWGAAGSILTAVKLIGAVFSILVSQCIAWIEETFKNNRQNNHGGAKVVQTSDPVLLASKGLVYRTGIYYATDLDFCKKIMSSSVWIDRVKKNNLMYVIQFAKPWGLIWGGGLHHRRARKVTTRLFHQLPFYKSGPLEDLVLAAATQLLSDIEGRLSQEESANEGVIMSPRRLFQPYVLSIVWQFMFGGDPKHSKVSPSDPALLQIHHNMTKASKKYTSAMAKENGHPFKGLISKIEFLWIVFGTVAHMYSLFQEIISERRRAGACDDSHQQPHDFLGGLSEELDRTKGTDPYLTEESVLVILRDMIFGSTETIGDAMEFALLQIALNETVQEKVKAEIDLVIGDSSFPSISHRARMVYTQATLLEALRIGSVVQVGTRVAREDTIVDGISFQKGSVVVIKQLKIHESEQMWSDPSTFRPERFIANDNMGLVNTEKVIPFGFGKRSCIGEQLGQLTLFIFFVTLLQKFRFTIPKELPPPSMEIEEGFGRAPATYHLRVVPRAQSEKKNFLRA